MKAVYDIWGYELYDKVWNSTSFATEQTRLIAESLQPASKILDIATGTGNVAKKLVEQGKDVTGVDISQKSLNYVVNKIDSPKFTSIRQDAQVLDYDGEFNGGSCASNMAYFEDPTRIVSPVYQALKPKGLFAVTGYEANQMKRMIELMGDEVQSVIREGRINLSEDELAKLPEAQKHKIETIDSSQRTRGALQKSGFRILRDEKFYHDTAYFILAQRD